MGGEGGVGLKDPTQWPFDYQLDLANCRPKTKEWVDAIDKVRYCSEAQMESSHRFVEGIGNALSAQHLSVVCVGSPNFDNLTG